MDVIPRVWTVTRFLHTDWEDANGPRNRLTSSTSLHVFCTAHPDASVEMSVFTFSANSLSVRNRVPIFSHA